MDVWYRIGGISIRIDLPGVGWSVPFAIAGTYVGLLLDARVKGGTIESQMYESVLSIVVGTVVGFMIGAHIDSTQRWRGQDHDGDEGPMA